jgi:hypothetical protein
MLEAHTVRAGSPRCGPAPTLGRHQLFFAGTGRRAASNLAAGATPRVQGYLMCSLAAMPVIRRRPDTRVAAV